MTVANLLTLLRILLTPLLVIFLLERRLEAALVVFILAGVTDGLDGMVARFYRQKSRLGAFLDPMADKLLLASTYVILSYQRLVPVWLTVIVLSRDVLIVLGVLMLYMQNLRVEIRPSMASKLTTFSQIVTAIVTMGAAILAPHPVLTQVLFIVTALLTVASWTQYIIRGLRIIHATGNNRHNR